MKIVFAGTPEFAVKPLAEIVAGGFSVVGVITQEDKPQGRKGILTPPPVKTKAEELGLPVLQPHKIREEVEAVKALGGDLLVTCAYGQLLTQDVLDAFPMGVWNIHAGLLPAYRGASPIQSCIANGETQTGVSIMKTELGLDCGDVLTVEKTEILPEETYGELSDRLSALSAPLIVKALKMLESGGYTLTPQGEEGVHVYRKISKELVELDFSNPQATIINTVRAANPAPVAYAMLEGNPLNVYRAEGAPMLEEYASAACAEVVCDIPKRGLIVRCGDGVVKLTEVQAAGGKRMQGSDFLNGKKIRKGQVFSC
jgi:methionyl-tRNA formyltransferase